MKEEIAIVEDEPALRENYREILTRQGYKVRAYGSRQEALTEFNRRLPDLVILDIGLRDDPEGGFELCRLLRSQSSQLPIIFLTARDSDLDAVSGLRLGADDYLTKDISLHHLTARIAALFRRIQALLTPADEDALLQQDELRLDSQRLEVSWREQTVALTVTELWLVHALARRPGHVRSREQLMADANILVDPGTITSHIKRIRRKFQLLDPTFDAIEAVYAVGYRWRPRKL